MFSRVKTTYISILTAWLFLSVFVDFLIIPTAFKQLSDIFIAGELGIRIFSALNYFEVVFSIFVLYFAYLLLASKRSKKDNIIILLSLILVAISALYFFYLTDKIAALTELWKSSMVISEQAIEVVKKDHSFYHNLYVKTDAAKIVILSICIGLSMTSKKEAK